MSADARVARACRTLGTPAVTWNRIWPAGSPGSATCATPSGHGRDRTGELAIARNGLAVAKCVAGRYDWRSQARLLQMEQRFHGIANSIMQSVLIAEGHAERVEAAHGWRLK